VFYFPSGKSHYALRQRLGTLTQVGWRGRGQNKIRERRVWNDADSFTRGEANMKRCIDCGKEAIGNKKRCQRCHLRAVQNDYKARSIGTWGLKDKLIRQRGKRCERCGASSRLEMHHIKRVIDGGKSVPENLLLLCPTCHRAETKKQRGRNG
jgi:5-methylcytosine-specific restriction endonuclease McrA